MSSTYPMLLIVVVFGETGDRYLAPVEIVECRSNMSEKVTQQIPGEMPDPWPVP